MTSTSAQLQRKAEQARERLSDRLEDLREHLSPSLVIDDLLDGLGWLIYSETRGTPSPVTASKRRSTGKRRTRHGKTAAAQAMPARRKPSR